VYSSTSSGTDDVELYFATNRVRTFAKRLILYFKRVISQKSFSLMTTLPRKVNVDDLYQVTVSYSTDTSSLTLRKKEGKNNQPITPYYVLLLFVIIIPLVNLYVITIALHNN
jgi:hypothetical protein